MYICPVCQKEYNTETAIQKHFLACWKEKFPCHQAKSAPRSEDIIKRTVNNDMANFFNSFQKE